MAEPTAKTAAVAPAKKPRRTRLPEPVEPAPQPDPEAEGRLGLGIRSYAAHRKHLGLPGSATSAVQRALAAGRIHRFCPEHACCPSTCPKGRIDPHEADIDWEANTDPDRTARHDRASVLQDANAAWLIYRARLARLKYEKDMRNLVPIAEVRAEEFRKARRVRDAFLPLGRRLRGRLAAETDPEVVERLLSEAIKRALASLANDVPIKTT